jgi:hypothetical protein
VNDTLSATQIALSAVPGVALALTVKLLIGSYRTLMAGAAEPTWSHRDNHL